MSDDSSDDDEPMFESPPTSDDDENDNGKDVFKYQAHKFQRANKPEIAAAANPQANDPVIEKLKQIEQREQQSARKKKRFSDELSDDDDDSIPWKSRKHAIGRDGAEVLDVEESSPGAKAVASKKPQNSSVVELIDSDSDDEDEPKYKAGPMVFATCLKNAPPDVLETLIKSQLASQKLQAAHFYHAEDVHVQVEEPKDFRRKWQPVVPAQAQQPKPVKLGKAMRVTCRCQKKINGKIESTTEKTFKVHENQHLSVLLASVLKEYSIPSDARVSLNFDGLVMNVNKTFASYEIEDEDLIDVQASIIAMPGTVVGSSASMSSGPKLKLTLRRKVGKKTTEVIMITGANDKFQMLLDKYISKENIRGRCSFVFDGEKVDPNKTPANYEMEDEDLMDVTCS